MEKKEIIQKLAERKKMFEDYLALIRRQPRPGAGKVRHAAGKAGQG